jgi:hypothetical protein
MLIVVDVVDALEHGDLSSVLGEQGAKLARMGF